MNIQSAAQPLAEKPIKRVSWLNEIEFGMTTLVGRQSIVTTDTGYGFSFSISGGNNVANNRVDVLKLTPKTINPGFSLGFAIREKTRKIGNTGLNFITGSRFRYSRFTGSGRFEISQIKATVKDGVVTYYPDSVYSTKAGDYKTVTSSFQLLFPFMVERRIQEKHLSISAGLNLGIHIVSSKISDNIKDNYTNSLITYINPQFIQFQPIVKATYKRTSVYLSYNLGKTRIGYGSTKNTTGNMMYFGLAYKLY